MPNIVEEVTVEETTQKETVDQIAMRGLMAELEAARGDYCTQRRILERVDTVLERQANAPQSRVERVIKATSGFATSWFFWAGVTGVVAAIGKAISRKDS